MDRQMHGGWTRQTDTSRQNVSKTDGQTNRQKYRQKHRNTERRKERLKLERYTIEKQTNTPADRQAVFDKFNFWLLLDTNGF